VEERDPVQQFGERLLFPQASLEERLIFYRIRLVAAEHVRLQPRRRLVGHLDAVLQHGHRKLKIETPVTERDSIRQ